ncbi:MAG: hypothetical protein KDD88_10500, partial [Rhodobacteraceae bacterium]|nr:hypothetical protein [Paracoccaceae bacterium]
MGRGFLTGLIYGAGLSAASLVGVTLVIPFASPMPELGIAPAPAEAPAAPASEAPAAEAPAAEAASAPAAAP